eukprot:scaffold26190_cov119-Isochrysis_galbana.AAC.3
MPRKHVSFSGVAPLQPRFRAPFTQRAPLPMPRLLSAVPPFPQRNTRNLIAEPRPPPPPALGSTSFFSTGPRCLSDGRPALEVEHGRAAIARVTPGLCAREDVPEAERLVACARDDGLAAGLVYDTLGDGGAGVSAGAAGSGKDGPWINTGREMGQALIVR